MKIVPQIDNLRIKDFLWLLENKCVDALKYLPNDYEKKSLNRQWLCNLCIIQKLNCLGKTFNQNDFEIFVENAIKDRQNKFIQKHNMEIETDSRIVSAFEKSNFISSICVCLIRIIATKGRSHMLIRKSSEVPVRRQLREENKDEEDKDENKDSQILYLKNEVAKLKEELRVNNDSIDRNDKYADLLNDLFHKGIIDEEGNFLNDMEGDQD